MKEKNDNNLTKSKKVTARGLAACAITLGVIATTSVIYVLVKDDVKTINGVPVRVEINIDNLSNDAKLENRSSYVISNGKVIKVFKADEVYYLVNKETNEIGEYLFYSEENRNKYLCVMYDLNTEEVVYYSDVYELRNYEYYEYLKQNCYFVPLKTVLDSISGSEIKEYYSLDEIKEIEDYVIKNSTINVNKKAL